MRCRGNSDDSAVMKSKQTSQYARAVGRGLNADLSHMAITITWQQDVVVNPAVKFRRSNIAATNF